MEKIIYLCKEKEVKKMIINIRRKKKVLIASDFGDSVAN